MSNPYAAMYAAMSQEDRHDLLKRFDDYCQNGNKGQITFQEAGVLIWLANRPVGEEQEKGSHNDGR